MNMILADLGLMNWDTYIVFYWVHGFFQQPIDTDFIIFILLLCSK